MRPYNETTKTILLSFALAGSIIIAASSPWFGANLAQKLLDEKFLKKEIERWKLARALSRLKKHRLLVLQEKDNGTLVIELSEKGKRVVQEIQVRDLAIEIPAAWDKKWRIVIADIPEKLGKLKTRNARDALREKLLGLGFYPFQKSVWVIPWSCEKEVLLLCELFDITKYVNILTTEHIYNDIALRKHFHLL